MVRMVYSRDGVERRKMAHAQRYRILQVSHLTVVNCPDVWYFVGDPELSLFQLTCSVCVCSVSYLGRGMLWFSVVFCILMFSLTGSKWWYSLNPFSWELFVLYFLPFVTISASTEISCRLLLIASLQNSQHERAPVNENVFACHHGSRWGLIESGSSNKWELYLH